MRKQEGYMRNIAQIFERPSIDLFMTSKGKIRMNELYDIDHGIKMDMLFILLS